jgi:hypothetical protein
MRELRPALAQRYSIHLPLELGDATPRFVATDISTGQSVVVAFVGPELARLRARAVGAMQRHLAGLIEAVEHPAADAFPGLVEPLPAGGALVVELIRGRTLADVIRSEPMTADRAVAWTMRVLQGLQALHRRRVPHGAISCHSIVAEPKGRPIAPVLSQLVVPQRKDHASPERLSGSGPTIADDLWAVGVSLFEMLTQRLPLHSAPTASAGSVIAPSDGQQLRSLPHGRELEAILGRLLSVDRSRRPGSAEELIDWFDHWERRVLLPAVVVSPIVHAPTLSSPVRVAPWDHFVDDTAGTGERIEAALEAADQMRQSAPPVVGDASPSRASGRWTPSAPDVASGVGREPESMSSFPSAVTAWRRMPTIGEMDAFRERSRPRVSRLLAALTIFAILAAVGAVLLGRRDERGQGASALVAAKSVELAASPAGSARASARPTAKQEQSQCIRAYFRPDAIVEGTDLTFVCTEQDFLVVNRRLHEDSISPPQAASAAEQAQSTVEDGTTGSLRGERPTAPAMVIRSGAPTKGWQLGWYELVATAIIQQNCCREAAPIKLPESAGWCQQLQTVVRRIAADSAKVGDISPGVRTFDEAVTCLLAQGRPAAYSYKAVPTPAQKYALQQFLKHAAEIDARRTVRR